MDRPINLPCGRCIGCRLEKSRQWAVRCVHEAQLHQENSFITLTFNQSCPLDGTKTDPTYSLHKHHFQRFMKRLRKEYPEKQIKYFHCGEYGEKSERPHHHACLFNHDFEDKILYKESNGIKLYTSEKLQKLWPFGHSTIGDVTFDSAAYVARYITKKITGKLAEEHYKGRLPEFCTMSRRPAIAKQWLQKYTSDVYPQDYVVIRGKKSKPSKYYDKQLELTNPKEYETIKAERVFKNRGNPNNATERLEAGEIIVMQKLSMLTRTI